MSNYSSDCWPDLALTGRYRGHLKALPQGHWLSEGAALAFTGLQQAAQQDGFVLRLASSFRDFERQEQIFSGKWRGVRPVHDDQGRTIDVSQLTKEQKLHAILRFSALPGASRHHWGTDMDLYCARLQGSAALALSPTEYSQGGRQFALAQWLADNARRFDFILPYDQDRGGVAVEPWHLSYAPQAEPMLARLSADKLADALSYGQVVGRDYVLANIDAIMSRYVTNVGTA